MMNNNFNLQPSLENELVLLKPIKEDDFESLFKVASDPAIWEQHPAKERSEREGFSKYFEGAIESKSAFLIIDKATGVVIGTSRYNLIAESAKAIEIGWTFLAKKYWGGVYNKAIKKLMMQHAFTQFEMILFYIDKNNLRSQKAVEKLGGQRINAIDGTELAIRPTAAFIYCIDKKQFEKM